MKKTFLMAALLFCAGGGFISSCSDDDETKDGPVTSKSPIESVTAVDGSKTATATISDDAKTIDFGTFENLIDLSAVQVTFKLAKGVVMKSPSKAETTVSLMQPLKVVVNNGKEDITYTMTGKAMEIPEPVKSVKVNGKDVPVTITEAGREIVIAYTDGMDVSALKLELSLENGATVKSPEGDTTFDLELVPSGSLVVNFYDTDYTYTVKLSGYTNPFTKNEWTDESTKFGELPEYIKVFKTDKAAGKANNIAYAAVIGKGATMNVLGDGNKALKTIKDFEDIDGSYNVYLVGVQSSCVQTIVREGNLIQEGSPYTLPTIGQDADGNFSMNFVQRFNNVLYSFPFLNVETSWVARDVKDGTAWTVKTAMAGVQSMVWDGAVLSAAQIMANNQACNWYNGALNARAIVGLTKSGKVILFCNQQVDGSVGTTMPETAQIMVDLGCVTAFSLEGSSSPNLHINKMTTVKNSNVFADKALKDVQCALVFK